MSLIPRPCIGALAWCTLLGGCGACEPDPPRLTSDASPSGASASPSAAAADSVRKLLAGGTAQRQAALPCRAITVDGEVRLEGDSGVALAKQEVLAPDRWLSLSRGARLVAKDPRTSRESTFRGPGRVRACVDTEEESWVASGTFESASGAGETPGAEEWVVTSVGIVRFGSAKLSVDATPQGVVRVGVVEGLAFIWTAQDALALSLDGGAAPSAVDEGWIRAPKGGGVLVSTARRSPLEAARSEVGACSGIGQSAHELASALLAPDAGASTAARQVTLRRLARAACAVAALRVEMLPTSDAQESLSASLKDAAALWHSLPILH